MSRAHPISYCLDYIAYTPLFLFLFCFFACLCLFLFCLFIGNTLTPLTALTPVSDVGKTMLQPSSLSVLGDHQQFQAGLFCFYFCLFVCLFIFICLFILICFDCSISISQKLLNCSCVTVCQKASAMKFFDLL